MVTSSPRVKHSPLLRLLRVFRVVFLPHSVATRQLIHLPSLMQLWWRRDRLNATNRQNRPSEAARFQLTEKEGQKVVHGDKHPDLISFHLNFRRKEVAFAAGQKSLCFYFDRDSPCPSLAARPPCMGALWMEREGFHSFPRLQRECRLHWVKSASVW